MSLAIGTGLAPDMVRRYEEASLEARRYILGRQSPSAGFCFYRTDYVEEPGLFDTWHAVAALALLNQLPPHHDEVIYFVCSTTWCPAL